LIPQATKPFLCNYVSRRGVLHALNGWIWVKILCTAASCMKQSYVKVIGEPISSKTFKNWAPNALNPNDTFFFSFKTEVN